MANLVDPLICGWSTAQYLIFSQDFIGNFLYYSHLFPSISGLIIAIFVLRSNYRNKAAQALLFTTSMFAIWCFMALTTWASERSDIIMFVWSAMMYPELLMYVGAFYFIYAFLNNTFPDFKTELFVFLMFVPLFLFGHTKLNVVSFDFTNCERNAVEGPLWQYYVYGFEFLFIGIILSLTISGVKKNVTNRREILIVSIGMLSFLLLFSWQNIVGSFFDNWRIGQIGLFGMPLFVALLGYILVRYQTFRVKLLATEALMAAQLILLVSLLFVRSIENAQIIAIITILFFSTLGVLLIKSVRQEVEQREQIEKLATSLEQTNVQLKIVDKQKSEFVSIASHQLRSPLTAIRGYASMILDGNFGTPPPEMIDPIDRIHESAKMMAFSIDDFLNVSRIESGNMKYESTVFSLVKQVEQIVTDKQDEAKRAGLSLTFETTCGGDALVMADLGKTHQILHNLITNAIKYTPTGTIHVQVHDDSRFDKLYVQITDTGIGMNPATIADLFQKFSRANNANSVNIKGTGLGLYVAREMASAMKGTIFAYSDGDGKGSRFAFTLPAATATPPQTT